MTPAQRALLPLLPALGLLTLFLGVPLAITAYQRLTPNVLIHFDGLGPENYLYLIGKPFYADVILRTLRIAVVTTLGALFLGYPAAYVLKNLSGGLGSTIVIGLAFPILAGPLVVVLGWMILLAEGGPVLSGLGALGIGRGLRLIGSETAIEISLIQFTLPFVVLTIFSSLRQIPEDLLEAARSLGADRLRAFLQVSWPLSLPGVLSATLIAFSLAVSAYVSPHYLGGDTRQTLTTLIGQFILATYNSPMAATLGMLLLVIVLAVMFTFSTLVSGRIRP